MYTFHFREKEEEKTDLMSYRQMYLYYPKSPQEIPPQFSFCIARRREKLVAYGKFWSKCFKYIY